MNKFIELGDAGDRLDSGLFLIKKYFDLSEGLDEEKRLLALLSISHYHVKVKLVFRSDKDVWGLYLSQFAVEKLVNLALKQEPLEDCNENSRDN
ncbi:hypothetical protein [Coleofasciculus sp. FACHB-SPT9]|uniref:hypothetical protein n=1 Tax=Cyanophyceae TaxID=3028117 RepID=UPI0016844DDD|nr:hypothetical protein [Coleofasciculus sp. FACHB-SPT9]MBD1887939.1 hypothetical protein [Coleofasciculus sp. FACHB-SPT9]